MLKQARTEENIPPTNRSTHSVPSIGQFDSFYISFFGGRQALCNPG